MNQDFKARILRHLDRLFELNRIPFKSVEESWEQKRLIDEISSLLAQKGYQSLRDFFDSVTITPNQKLDSRPLHTDIQSSKISESSQKNSSNSSVSLRDMVSKILRYVMVFSNIVYQVQTACAEIGKSSNPTYETNKKSAKKEFLHKSNVPYDYLGQRYLDEYRKFAKRNGWL